MTRKQQRFLLMVCILLFMPVPRHGSDSLNWLLGRIYQIQYAMEAIAHSGSAIGVLSKEGVVLIGARLVSPALLDFVPEKIKQINSQICCALTGI